MKVELRVGAAIVSARQTTGLSDLELRVIEIEWKTKTKGGVE